MNILVCINNVNNNLDNIKKIISDLSFIGLNNIDIVINSQVKIDDIELNNYRSISINNIEYIYVYISAISKSDYIWVVDDNYSIEPFNLYILNNIKSVYNIGSTNDINYQNLIVLGMYIRLNSPTLSDIINEVSSSNNLDKYESEYVCFDISEIVQYYPTCSNICNETYNVCYDYIKNILVNDMNYKDINNIINEYGVEQVYHCLLDATNNYSVNKLAWNYISDIVLSNNELLNCSNIRISINIINNKFIKKAILPIPKYNNKVTIYIIILVKDNLKYDTSYFSSFPYNYVPIYICNNIHLIDSTFVPGYIFILNDFNKNELINSISKLIKFDYIIFEDDFVDYSNIDITDKIKINEYINTEKNIKNKVIQR